MAKHFLDTNLLIYAVGDDETKRSGVHALVASITTPVISTQVVGEFVNACLKKHILSPEETYAAARDWLDGFDIHVVSPDTLRRAMQLKAQAGFSWWDSLIVAAALESGCRTLYSEDLQHDQQIQSLRVVNPFHA